MATTIQVSEKLQNKLKERKISDSESYEDIIWDLLEDTMELREEAKNDIEKSRKEIKEGKFYTLESMKKGIDG